MAKDFHFVQKLIPEIVEKYRTCKIVCYHLKKMWCVGNGEKKYGTLTVRIQLFFLTDDAVIKKTARMKCGCVQFIKALCASWVLQEEARWDPCPVAPESLFRLWTVCSWLIVSHGDWHFLRASVVADTAQSIR